MVLDPVMLPALSVLVPVGVGAMLLRAGPGGRAQRGSGMALLALGLCTLALSAAPPSARAPLSLLGDCGVIAAFGALWGAARLVDGRPAPKRAMMAGAALWLVLAVALDPPVYGRIGATTALMAAYAIGTAWEHHAGRVALPSRGRLSWIFLVHGGVALLAVAFGLAPRSVEAARDWADLEGLEMALVSVLIGVFTLAMTREREAARAGPAALEDGLTGIGNGEALLRSGAPLVASSCAGDRPAALLMVDLDGLSALNEAHGRAAVDRLIVAVAHVLHDYLPPTSLVCRLEGGAFAAVLPGADPSRARAVAEGIRALLAHVTLDAEAGPLRATVSIGIAQAEPRDAAAARDVPALLARAGLCLRSAKRSGRNRVVGEREAEAPDRSAAA